MKKIVGLIKKNVVSWVLILICLGVIGGIVIFSLKEQKVMEGITVEAPVDETISEDIRARIERIHYIYDCCKEDILYPYDGNIYISEYIRQAKKDYFYINDNLDKASEEVKTLYREELPIMKETYGMRGFNIPRVGMKFKDIEITELGKYDSMTYREFLRRDPDDPKRNIVVERIWTFTWDGMKHSPRGKDTIVIIRQKGEDDPSTMYMDIDAPIDVPRPVKEVTEVKKEGTSPNIYLRYPKVGIGTNVIENTNIGIPDRVTSDIKKKGKNGKVTYLQTYEWIEDGMIVFSATSEKTDKDGEYKTIVSVEDNLDEYKATHESLGRFTGAFSLYPDDRMIASDRQLRSWEYTGDGFLTNRYGDILYDGKKFDFYAYHGVFEVNDKVSSGFQIAVDKESKSIFFVKYEKDLDKAVKNRRTIYTGDYIADYHEPYISDVSDFGTAEAFAHYYQDEFNSYEDAVQYYYDHWN